MRTIGARTARKLATAAATILAATACADRAPNAQLSATTTAQALSQQSATAAPRVVARPTRAIAGATGGGELSGNRLTVGLSVATDGRSFTPAHHTSVQGPYYYRSYQFIPNSTFVAGSCALPTPPGIGIVLLVEMYERATGSLIDVSARCVPAVQPGAPLVIPDPPPTIGEIWDAVTLPTPSLNLSPAAEGVTGLDTWLWSTSPATIAIDVAIGPWRVAGTATRTGFIFDPGEGENTTTNDGGSPQQPSALHQFEIKGNYSVAVGTTWTATVTMSGPGLVARPTPIGNALLSTAQTYQVVEIRSVLTG